MFDNSNTRYKDKVSYTVSIKRSHSSVLFTFYVLTDFHSSTGPSDLINSELLTFSVHGQHEGTVLWVDTGQQ